MRLVRPFMLALRKYQDFPEHVLEPLARLDPDERLPVDTMHELMRGAIELSGDPDLGLKAAREIEMGDYGALEYVASSAPTWGDAIRAIGRYMPLVNDALDFVLEIRDGRAEVQLHSRVALPRAAADFQSAAFHVATLHRSAPDLGVDAQVWFTHERPKSIDEYERTFARSTLHFGKPFNGFVFDEQWLALPLSSADPKLHQVIRKHADLVLAELPRTESLTQKVRDLLARELAGGNPGAPEVARKLGMSARTLGRRLEEEGTTFKELADDVRRRLALRYVGGQDLGLSEVAFLLGFSQAPAFHRAFKRWTGRTPLEYRRAHRG